MRTPGTFVLYAWLAAAIAATALLCKLLGALD